MTKGADSFLNPGDAGKTMITMLGYEQMLGSSQVLEDEVQATQLRSENCVPDAGDVTEWLEHKLHELKRLARV